MTKKGEEIKEVQTEVAAAVGADRYRHGRERVRRVWRSGRLVQDCPSGVGISSIGSYSGHGACATQVRGTIIPVGNYRRDLQRLHATQHTRAGEMME